MNKYSFLPSNIFWLLLLMAIPFSGYSQEELSQSSRRIIAMLKVTETATMRVASGGKSNVMLENTAIQSLNQHYGVVRMMRTSPMAPKDGPLNQAIDRIVYIDFAADQNIEKTIEAYKATGLFEYVVPDGRISADVVPADQYINTGSGNTNHLWGLLNDGNTPARAGNPIVAGADTDASLAWDITTGNPNIVIAIVDTGVNPVHYDLDNNIWVNADETSNGADSDGNGYVDDTKGYAFISSPAGSCTAILATNPDDDNGHGTHVASEASAQADNAADGGGFKGGTVGMTWNCKIMPVKVLDCTNNGQISDVVLGIRYAADNGAHVINLSLSTNSYAAALPLEAAIDYAYGKGVTVVASMGNTNLEEARYPGAFTHAIAVGSTNGDDTRTTSFNGTANGSVYFRHTDIVAPGNQIYGAARNTNTNHAFMSGTSFSTPYVAGAAALLLSLQPGLSPAEVRHALHKGVEDQVGNGAEDVAGWDKYHGYGRLNAFNSVNGLNTSATYGRITSYPYTESFESTPGSWVAGGSQFYSWTWGPPSGTNINTASAGTKAWTMGSAVVPVHNTYSPNESSVVESPVFDFSTLTKPQIALDIYVDAEAGTDGAVLQYSTDNGVNWTALGAVNSCNSANWYDNTVTSLGMAGWSAPTSGWKTAKHDLSVVAGQSRVQFRFLFKSNGATQNEGFAFDNIIIQETPTTTYASGAWNNGEPDSFTNAVINSAYTSTGNITCANLTLNAAYNLGAGHNLTVFGSVTNPNNIAANRNATVILSGCSAQNIQGAFGNLTVNNTNGVTLNGATTVQRMLDLQVGAVTTGGNLTLQSDATGTAMVGFNGGSISGIATMQRYLPDNGAQAWATAITGDYYRYFSTPFTDETVDGMTATGYNLEISKATDFNTNWNQGLSPFPNFFLYDESRIVAGSGDAESLSKGWNVPTVAGNTLTSGRGFLAHIGDEVTATSTGTLQTGNVTVNSISKGALPNSAWHLLGNPYPAPIDLPTLLTNNNAVLEQSAYFLIANANFGDSWLSYVSGVVSPGTLTGWDQKISPMQGFFTKAANAGTVTFTRDNIVQKTYNSPNFYRKTETRPLLRLQIKNGDYQDEVVCYFEEGGHYQALDVDKDAHKFGYNGIGWPTLFMPIEDEQKLSINGLPLKEGEIPLTLWAEQEGRHEFIALQKINFEGFLGAYLEDRITGVYTPLHEGASYAFEAEKGFQQDRFFIHFAMQDPTGVEESWEEAGIYAFSTGKNIRLNLLKPSAIPMEVKLFDLQGKEIAHWSNIRQSQSLELNLQNPTGIYVLQVLAQGAVLQKRLYLE